jgi:hypothetical protein
MNFPSVSKGTIDPFNIQYSTLQRHVAQSLPRVITTSFFNQIMFFYPLRYGGLLSLLEIHVKPSMNYSMDSNMNERTNLRESDPR